MKPRHRHRWFAVPMTNLVVCRCGEQRRYWEVPVDEEPFQLGRYAPPWMRGER